MHSYQTLPENMVIYTFSLTADCRITQTQINSFTQKSTTIAIIHRNAQRILAVVTVFKIQLLRTTC